MKSLTTRCMMIGLTMLFGAASLDAAEKLDTDKHNTEKQQAETERLLLDVKSVLRAEQKGTISDRERVLAPLLDSENAPDEAYWQAGYLKQGDRWISVKDRPLSAEQEAARKEYAAVRSKYDNSEQSHWELARWCHEHQLDEQCRAHLMAILLDHPDHVGLRQMLGYQKIGNRWMNREEYEFALEQADEMAKELQQWGPKVASIREDLKSPLVLKRNGAKTRLKDILDVAAVPALEMILLPDSEEAASLCVEQLCQIKNRRASIALCKAAMFLPDASATTKQAAIEELKTRPLEDFVPVLLGKMQTPLTVIFWLQQRLNGGFNNGPFNLPQPYFNWQDYFSSGYSISTEKQHELVNYTKYLFHRDLGYHRSMVDRNGFYALRAQASLLESFPLQTWDINLIRKMDSKSLSQLAEKNRGDYLNSLNTMLEVNKNIRTENQQNSRLNNDIADLLGKVTDSSIHEFPEYWWKWWATRIEVDTQEKVNRKVVEADEWEVLHLNMSCFVAGTPVWTERGAIPIEQLRVGDRALSKDVETGEVAYRPIIRTTTREPKPLVVINLGVEQITSTGGHPFWVAGEGWVRASQLKAGQILHTPTGTMTIESVSETDDDKTYNLVVDGFHTYFVGMSQVLVHDVSITSPTDAVVPGLVVR